jgi:hypothetical protein
LQRIHVLRSRLKLSPPGNATQRNATQGERLRLV